MNSDIDDKLDSFLDVNTEMKKSQPPVVTAPIEHYDISKERDREIQDDYEFRRETLYQLIGKGQDALENLLHVAKESDHPRAYEVTGQLMKTTADLVKDLTTLQIDCLLYTSPSPRD